MPPSLRDIAKQLHVAPSTVSLALAEDRELLARLLETAARIVRG